MTKPTENTALPTSERLKEVALLLKQADKLVKEGDLATALTLIAKARSFDSRHLYALAYEERVRTLLTAKQQEEAKKGTKQPLPAEKSVEQKIAPALQHLSNLAIIEAQHSANVAVQQEQAVEIHKKEEAERTKNDELRRKAIEAKIAAFLTRANMYLQKKEFNRALDEIARAYLLDPVNDSIHALEDTIRKAQEDFRRDEEGERQRKMDEDRQKRQETIKTQSKLYQKEKEEKIQREEQDRKRAREEKVQQYLQHVNELYQSNKLDEALGELAFVVVIDPLNEEVLRLEQKILETQDQLQQQQLEQYQKHLADRQKKREMVLATIKKHISNAEMLAKQKKFTDALHTITRATVLDPINDELQECEQGILAMQEEYFRQEEESKRALQEQIRRQQEEEVLRLEQTDRSRALLGETEEVKKQQKLDKEKIQQYLERAKNFLAEKQFEVALGEVALAFIINPFDEDVKMVEHMIIREREEHQAAKNVTAHEAVLVEQKNKSIIAEKMKGHMAEAEHLRSKSLYSKAFNEVAKAFILDPLNEEIQRYEQELQSEFDAYLFDQHTKRERDEKSRDIERHIRHAAELLERELFEEALAETAGGLAMDEQNNELLKLREQISKASDEWKLRQREESRSLEIQQLLVVAKEYCTVGKYDEAVIAVRKALDYEPDRKESIALLKEIESITGKELEDHRTTQRRERIASYRDQAEALLTSNMPDKALVQIVSGLVIDPSNEELLQLEQRVTALHNARLNQMKSTAITSSLSHPRISKDEQDRLIRIHIRVAEEFLSQKEYAKALDEIAHGLTVDMLNEELMKFDAEIRAEQAAYDLKAAQGLKLIYSSGQATG